MRSTAQGLVEACFATLHTSNPEVSLGIAVDFGLDPGAPKSKDGVDARFLAYCEAILTGKLDAQQLHNAVGNGPELSKLLDNKVEIWTVWDCLEGRYPVQA